MKNEHHRNERGRIYFFLLPFVLSLPLFSQVPVTSPDASVALLNEPYDISGDFRSFTNAYYLADSLAGFDPATGKRNNFV